MAEADADLRAVHETGETFPDFETWNRICELFGWPQTFEMASER